MLFRSILGNYIHDNGGPGGDYTDPSQDNTSHGLYLSPSFYGLIANNLIQHNDAKGLMGRHNSDHLMIVHNTIIANGRYGTESFEQTHDWTWANNVIINNANVKGGYGLSMSGTGPGFLNRNNVFWNNGTNGNNHVTGTGTSQNQLVSDPVLVNPTPYSGQQDPSPNWNNRLQATSPAIGYGDSNYGMPTDLLGNPRNGRYDCGCYQFV